MSHAPKSYSCFLKAQPAVLPDALDCLSILNPCNAGVHSLSLLALACLASCAICRTKSGGGGGGDDEEEEEDE